MGTKTNTFQIVLIGVFAACIVIGVIVFSKVRGTSGVVFSPVTIWGTISKEAFDSVYSEVNQARTKKEGALNVTYVQKGEDSFDHDFIEALASGVGPDAIILDQGMLLRHKDKIFPIPFENFSLRDFKDDYIDESELFVDDTGILGLPFFIDPMVMYWNRDTFGGNALASPPRLWTEFFGLTEKLTEKDRNNNILRSAVAFGEFVNVTNAKDILSMLFLQAGNPITKIDNGKLKSSLNSSTFLSSASESVLTFYTEFSNPSKVSYSWNRSMPESKKLFLAGDLALYFGFGSELSDLRAKNPNLNFDVAPVPQPKDAKIKVTFGRMYAFAVLKSAKDIAGTFGSVYALADKKFLVPWVARENVAPPRRDMLSENPGNADLKVFYDSAIMSRGWLDPNVAETSLIFKDLVESISSGKLRISEAISRASQNLDSLIE
ncbi:MAG: extracellular solute-binding protein [Candidatus Taylorbacteria bacterium]